MLTLIGSNKTRAARVAWLLEELGQPFTHVPAGPQSAEARARNPIGKVPVLLADGQSITDSTAILTYLADKNAQFTATAGTLARAAQDSMTQFLLDEFDAILWTAARHSFALPPEHRLPEIKSSLKWEYSQSLARLADRFQGPFLMGAEMTIPDFIATHCLGWGQAIKFGTLEGALVDYLARMHARPAYVRAMAA